MLPTIKIFGFEIGTYWLMFVLGTAAMSVMNSRRREKIGIGRRTAIILGVYMAICGLIGAKLLYIIENFNKVLETGIMLGGTSFYGTVFFMPVALVGAGAVLKKSKLAFIDFATPTILLMLSFMRVGCFLNGCCGGIGVDICGIYIKSIPAQLIELAMDLCIMLFLLKWEKKERQSGELYPLFMVLYGIGRFLIEFIRERNILFFGISNGQIFSIIAVIIGFCVYFVVNAHKNIK